MKDEDLLDEARERFKVATEACAEQRRVEKDDLQFQVPELQWTEDARSVRQRSGRPMLSISKVDQPIRLVMNQLKNARLGVEIHPVSEQADKDGAEVRQGIYRRIERDSPAHDAREWAFQRALICGTGAYRVTTKYDEDSPETFDQEIVIQRIQNQESVWFDPAAVKPDRSDGDYAFVATWMPKAEFRRTFPKAKLSTAGEMSWQVAAESVPDWVNATRGDEAALVAEYWYKKHTIVKIEAEIDGEKVSRERDEVKVYVCKISGDEKLEPPTLWPGKYIPIIPVIGRELQPFDGQRRFEGMMRKVKDGQRLYNHGASALVERQQLEPKAPYIGYTGQFEGHEEKWKRVNIDNYPYLEVNAGDVEGKGPLPIPQRSEVNTQGMSIAMATLQEADQFIQSSTSTFDPSLGRFPARERSGKAIRALQDQMETGTADFITDFARNAMRYEAIVVLDLMPHYYDRPGRILQILGEEGDQDSVMIGAPFVKNPDTGQPEPVGTMEGVPERPDAKMYDLSKGGYGVSISVGRSYQTRVQEGRAEMGQLLESQSELWPILGPEFLDFHDAPWAKPAAKILRKYRDKKFPGLAGDEDEPMNPEQTRARLAAAEDFIQKLQEENKQLQQQIQTEAVKMQGRMSEAQLRAMTQLKTAEMASGTKLQEAQLDAQVRILIEQMNQKFDALAEMMKQQAEDRRQLSKEDHEKVLKAADMAQKEEELKFKPPTGPIDPDDRIR